MFGVSNLHRPFVGQSNQSSESFTFREIQNDSCVCILDKKMTVTIQTLLRAMATERSKNKPDEGNKEKKIVFLRSGFDLRRWRIYLHSTNEFPMAEIVWNVFSLSDHATFSNDHEWWWFDILCHTSSAKWFPSSFGKLHGKNSIVYFFVFVASRRSLSTSWCQTTTTISMSSTFPHHRFRRSYCRQHRNMIGKKRLISILFFINLNILSPPLYVQKRVINICKFSNVYRR